jgi:4-amino-4-deoxy-L-arabinose transferase-like glycosyltransferase
VSMLPSAAIGAQARGQQGARGAFFVVAALCAFKAVLHLALIARYDFHGDELYFIECGRHLALGYVDHAPLVPWVARLCEELGGVSLVALRLPAVVAGTGTMVFVALMVRAWGGGTRAQVLSLLAMLIAPAYLRMATMLDIPVVETFFCTGASYFIDRALRRGSLKAWVLAGLFAGLALLSKHTALLWGAGLAIGLCATPQRRALRGPGPWLAVAIALVCFAPNVWWQAQNGVPTLEFTARLREHVLAEQGRALFVLAQLLYFHPLAVPVWIAGLIASFTTGGRDARPFAIQFLVMFAVLLLIGGKPYYLGAAYPPLLAVGAVAIERRYASRRGATRALAAAMAMTGIVTALLTLPLLPLPTIDRAIAAMLGWVVPPMALTHDLHGQFGWENQIAAVERVLESLPAEERMEVAVLTGNYSQAGALNVLRATATPRAVSGHMSYFLWGPGERPRARAIVAYGVPRSWLGKHCAELSAVGRIEAPLARPWESDLPIWLCRKPTRPLGELWPSLKRFHHRRPE